MADEFLLEAIKYNSGLVMAILLFTCIYLCANAVDVVLHLIKHHIKHDK